jgi:hypothetical protein
MSSLGLTNSFISWYDTKKKHKSAFGYTDNSTPATMGCYNELSWYDTKKHKSAFGYIKNTGSTMGRYNQLSWQLFHILPSIFHLKDSVRAVERPCLNINIIVVN